MTERSRLSLLRTPDAAEFAHSLRSGMTKAEYLFWYYVRARRFNGLKFRRQVPLGPYVVDFPCESRRVIVEIDGGQHATSVAEDAGRTRWLEERGYRVVRYWNNDVLGNLDGVLEDLARRL